MRNQSIFKIGILSSVLVLASACNSGVTNSATPTLSNASMKYSANTGNFPDIGGNGWGFQPNAVQLAGNLSSATDMSYYNMADIVVTQNAIYSLQANTQKPSSGSVPAYLMANSIDGSGSFGSAIGTQQGIGNENLDQNSSFWSTGNKIALSLQGGHLFVLANADKQVALMTIGANGIVSGDGSYPAAKFNSTPVSISVLPASNGAANSDEVIVLGRNGELDTFLRSHSTLTNYVINKSPCSGTSKVHFVDMAVDSSNHVYTIDADNNSMWIWKFSAQGGMNTPTQYTVGNVPVSVTAAQLGTNTYAYVLNRGAINTDGQSSISIFNNATKSVSTYSDSYGQGLIAKQIKTDGTNVFVFYSNPNANSTGSRNRVVSYSINPNDGSLTYIGTQKFGKTPFSYTSEFNQGSQTNLNEDLLYITDQGNSTTASSVTPFLHFNNQILEMSKHNVLYDCNVTSSSCNTNGASVIKMRKYIDDVSQNNYVFFLIKNGSTYKIKVVSVNNNGNNSFTTVNISGGNANNSYALSQFSSVSDMILAGHSLYVLGTNAKNSAYLSQYSINSSTTGILGISPTANTSAGNLIPSQISVSSSTAPKLLWFTQNGNDYVYALINNSDLVSYEQTGNGLKFLADTKSLTPGGFANGTFAHSGHALQADLFYVRPGSGSTQNVTTAYNISNGLVNTSSIYKTWANPCRLFSNGAATANVIGSFINSTPRSTNISAICSVLDTNNTPTYGIAAGGTGYNNGFTPSTNIVGGLNQWFVANNQQIAFTLDNKNLKTYYNNDDAKEPYFSYSQNSVGTLQAAYTNTTPQSIVLMPYPNPAIVILDKDGSLVLYKITSWNGDK